MSRTTSKQPDAVPAATTETESALRRWSRRKHEARVATQSESAGPDPAKVPDVATSEKSPERILTDADMPPLETLNEDSDYSPFMSPGVSDTLRQAALRRLFRSPQLNILCELEGEFYNTHGLTPLGNIVTFDMRAALERELERANSSEKEEIRRELTDAESFDAPSEPSNAAARPESSDRGESGADVGATNRDEKSPDNRGAT
jgi:Protein of unknown function (DUF3306)